MKLFHYKGRRIKPSDQYLVYRFVTGALVGIWLLAFLPFHLPFLWSSTWTLDAFQAHFIRPHGLVTLCISLFITAACAFLYYRYHHRHFKQIIHRQKLAKMILENGWYETKKVTSDSFFKDAPSGKTKETISTFPKVYYRLKNGHLHIQVEITLGKYQDPLLNLEKKLESGLYCELVSKELHDAYVEYVMVHDMRANRISIDAVTAQNGRLKLMKSLYWEYDQLPHMLIVGGTGGGKTYFILTLIEALSKTDAKLYVLDPKNADLADLSTVMPDVYHTKADMITCIDQFYADMMTRNENMKDMPNYKTGENYAYFGLPPNTLDTEASIEQGTQYLATLLKDAELKGVDDETVLQAYNYGGGFIDYVAERGSTYSFELAEAFAEAQSDGETVSYNNPVAVAENGGWRYGYGNMFYVDHVLQHLNHTDDDSNESIERITDGEFPTPDPSDYSGIHPEGECTYYVDNRRREIGAPLENSRLGDAGSWTPKAKASGMSTGSEPRAGAVMVYGYCQLNVSCRYGHVAFVETVNDDGSVVVSEMNWEAHNVINYRTVSASDASQLEYIY